MGVLRADCGLVQHMRLGTRMHFLPRYHTAGTQRTSAAAATAARPALPPVALTCQPQEAAFLVHQSVHLLD
jgi:hypothetical protein